MGRYNKLEKLNLKIKKNEKKILQQTETLYPLLRLYEKKLYTMELEMEIYIYITLIFTFSKNKRKIIVHNEKYYLIISTI